VVTSVCTRQRAAGRILLAAGAVLAGLLALLAPLGPSNAEECRDFGTEPFCDGECPGGWQEKGLASHECVTGRKVRCCKIPPPCGPAQFGTPGCPFPALSGWPGANIDRAGGDYANFDLNGAFPSDCRDACAKDGRCQAWTYVQPGVQGPKARCWLKSSVPPIRHNTCCISDVMERG
jgi:hypothetical protein